MDDSEYPTEAQLNKIRKWQFVYCPDRTKEFFKFMDYVQALWKWPDWGWEYSEDGNTFTLNTGGWSGNEDIIYAMKDNHLFWGLYWISSIKGGRYTFSANSVIDNCLNCHGTGVIFKDNLHEG